MNKVTSGTLLAATFLVACQQETATQTESDIAAIKGQLADLEQVFLSSGVPIENQLKNYLEFFADDPVLLPSDEDAVVGYDAALAYYTAGFEGGTVLDVDYHSHAPEIFLNGDMAIRRYIGSAEVQWDGEYENYSSYNRYIDILQRQADGEWRVVWHAWYPMDQ